MYPFEETYKSFGLGFQKLCGFTDTCTQEYTNKYKLQKKLNLTSII